MPTSFRHFALVALALTCANVTRAGSLHCESSEIRGDDARKMASVARKTAGSFRLVKSSLIACMNPGRGRASYDAKPVRQKDGATLEAHVVCVREQGPWSCELLKARTATFDLDFGDGKRSYDFEFPLWVETADARRLLARVSDLWPTIRSSQRCDWMPDPNKPGDGAQTLASTVAFKPEWPGGKKIVERPQAVAVVIHTASLEFVLTPEHNEWRFLCWRDGIEVP